jgi:hypothetical protein
VHASQVRRYHSRASACAACPFKPRCTTARQRAVTRLVDEDARCLKLRGVEGAAEEFTMAAAAYNLQLIARRAAPV